MDNNLKGLVMEIIILTLLLVIIVPICVNASNNYKEQKEIVFNNIGASIDITNNGNMEKVIIYSNNDKVIKVNLYFKLSKFLNDYDMVFGDKFYELNNFDYTEDEEFRYYNLGIYEIDNIREFDFKLNVKGNIYYDETLRYGFKVEG